MGTGDSRNFVQNLRSSNLIDREMFAMNFSPDHGADSLAIIFGDYDRDLVGSKTIDWEDNINDNRWVANLTKVLYGKDEVPLKTHWIQFTTAESHMRMCREDFAFIEEKLKKNYECSYKGEDHLLSCLAGEEIYDELEDIEIHLSKAVLYLEPHEYVKIVF